MPPDVSAKDVALAVVSSLGMAGGTGHVIEFAGRLVSSLTMEQRMTLCNMSIEAGATAALIAPDEVTFSYLAGRRFAPGGSCGGQPRSPSGASSPAIPARRFDAVVEMDVAALVPLVTWGTRPDMVVPIGGVVPDPRRATDAIEREAMERALEYMALEPGTPISEVSIDRVFIGSCTNARIEDLRAAARVARGHHVSSQCAGACRAQVATGQGRCRKRGARSHLPRRRIRVARAGMFDVPRDEPGCVEARRTIGVDEQSQLRGTSRSRRTHASGESGHGGGGGDPRALRRRARMGVSLMQPFRRHTGIVAPLLRRDIDTDQIVPETVSETARSVRGSGSFCFTTGGRVQTVRRTRPSFSTSPAMKARRFCSPVPTSAAARRASTPRGRYRTSASLRWSRRRLRTSSAPMPWPTDCCRSRCPKRRCRTIASRAESIEGYALEIDLEHCHVRDAYGLDHAFTYEEGARQRLLEGLDDIALILKYEGRHTRGTRLARDRDRRRVAAGALSAERRFTRRAASTRDRAPPHAVRAARRPERDGHQQRRDR